MEPIKKYYILCDSIKRTYAWASILNSQVKLLRMNDRYKLMLSAKSKMPFDLKLQRAFMHKGEFTMDDDLSKIEHFFLDNQPNDFGVMLISEKAKKVFETFTKEDEYIEYVQVDIIHENKRTPYYILRFKNVENLLNITKSIYDIESKYFTKIYFSFEKIISKHVFSSNHWSDFEIPISCYCSDEIKKAIKKHKLTGFRFEDINVAE